MIELTEILRIAKESVSDDIEAVILFGSHARGDYNSYSDIDVLVVSNRFHPTIRNGKFNISVYTQSQLKRFAELGSLFILHIIVESKLIYGVNLKPWLQKHYHRPSYNKLRNEVIEAAKVTDVSLIDYNNDRLSYIGVQKFLIRTYCYSLSIELEFFNFSISGVLKISNNEEFLYVFDRSHYGINTSYKEYLATNILTKEKFGFDIYNTFETVEALHFNNRKDNQLTKELCLTVLSKNSTGINYLNII